MGVASAVVLLLCAGTVAWLVSQHLALRKDAVRRGEVDDLLQHVNSLAHTLHDSHRQHARRLDTTRGDVASAAVATEAAGQRLAELDRTVVAGTRDLSRMAQEVGALRTSAGAVQRSLEDVGALQHEMTKLGERMTKRIHDVDLRTAPYGAADPLAPFQLNEAAGYTRSPEFAGSPTRSTATAGARSRPRCARGARARWSCARRARRSARRCWTARRCGARAWARARCG